MDNLSEITEVLHRIADAVEYLAAEHKKAEEIRKSKMEKRKEKAARDLWLMEHGYKTGLLTIVEDDE